jgi:hypothetical protein
MLPIIRTARIRKLNEEFLNLEKILDIKNTRTTLAYRIPPSVKDRKAIRSNLSHLAA